MPWTSQSLGQFASLGKGRDRGSWCDRPNRALEFCMENRLNGPTWRMMRKDQNGLPVTFPMITFLPWRSTIFGLRGLS